MIPLNLAGLSTLVAVIKLAEVAETKSAVRPVAQHLLSFRLVITSLKND